MQCIFLGSASCGIINNNIRVQCLGQFALSCHEIICISSVFSSFWIPDRKVIVCQTDHIARFFYPSAAAFI